MLLQEILSLQPKFWLPQQYGILCAKAPSALDWDLNNFSCCPQLIIFNIRQFNPDSTIFSLQQQVFPMGQTFQNAES